MRTPASPALAAVLPLLAAVLAAGSLVASGAPDGPRVALRTLDLSRVEGVLAGLDDAKLTLQPPGDGAARSFPLDEVIDVRFEEHAVPAAAGPRFRAHLVGGERLVGRFAGPAKDGMQLDVPGLGVVSLLFEHVLTLESMPAEDDPCHDLVSQHPRPASGDAAYDSHGDEYAGTVLEATKAALVLESNRGSNRKLAWDDLTLVHFENPRLKDATGLRAEVELQNGSRLSVVKLGLGAAGLELTLRSVPGQPLTAALDQVRALRWTGGRFEYASDLPHESETRQYHPDPGGLMEGSFLERWFGMRIDGRASGCPLRMGGETYRHGFGVYSRNLITLPLGEAYASFRADFGIDDEVLAENAAGDLRGNVDVRVLGDGKVLWEAKGVRGGEKPRSVGPLDVRGMKTLVLDVDFGKELEALDRGDWGNPILVKAEKR